MWKTHNFLKYIVSVHKFKKFKMEIEQEPDSTFVWEDPFYKYQSLPFLVKSWKIEPIRVPHWCINYGYLISIDET